jgi:hypothetical protein
LLITSSLLRPGARLLDLQQPDYLRVLGPHLAGQLVELPADAQDQPGFGEFGRLCDKLASWADTSWGIPPLLKPPCKGGGTDAIAFIQPIKIAMVNSMSWAHSPV